MLVQRLVSHAVHSFTLAPVLLQTRAKGKTLIDFYCIFYINTKSNTLRFTSRQKNKTRKYNMYTEVRLKLWKQSSLFADFLILSA